MSLVGEPPLQLTPDEVWQLCKDGFSVGEVAYLAGVSECIAQAMVNEALVHAQRGIETLRMRS